MERVKSKRTTQRALRTRLRTEARQVTDSNQLSLAALRVLSDRLKTCNDGLQKLNEQLEAFLTDEQAAEDFASVSEYEDNAAASLARLRHHMESLQAPCPPAREIDQQNEGFPLTPSAQPNGHGDHGGPGRVGARLPKLELPCFDGTVSQWQPFWDMFCRTVNANNHLTNIDRYHYLKILQSGPAEKAIAGVQVSEASYCVTIEILKKRFRSVKIIQRAYLANLITLKPVKSSGDVTELGELLNSVQINVRGLKALGLAELSYAAMLLEVLTKGIPSDIVVEYYKRQSFQENTRENQSSEAELEQLLCCLRIEVEAREKTGLIALTKRSLPDDTRGSIQQPSTFRDGAS
ncbi:uncharacterized protein LOC120838050 [Ixodes scapularis]|uniref:uncharacterized protein LOC120838050 n=1 Tax=Ixodes scapularis TaxID=6945 RepID=UPI001A9F16D8|nr:uncharacterized protein LOC120838050 [Ixodes scapularis]